LAGSFDNAVAPNLTPEQDAQWQLALHRICVATANLEADLEVQDGYDPSCDPFGAEASGDREDLHKLAADLFQEIENARGDSQKIAQLTDRLHAVQAQIDETKR
jgi:hypothetical protein